MSIKVGIITPFEKSKTENNTFYQINTYYINSVIEAGALPVLIPVTTNLDTINEYISLCDKFIFIGGGDIAPHHFGQLPHSSLSGVDKLRDIFEIAFIKSTFLKKKPVFGICRGCQVINVAFGGTIAQDIESSLKNSIPHSVKIGENTLRHNVAFYSESKLRDFLDVDFITSNSFHHQSIDKLGENLLATGRTSDGVTEIIESNNTKSLILGVQFHPEKLAYKNETSLNIFKYFINSHSKKKEKI